MPFIDILLIILVIVGIALVIYLFFWLQNIRKTINVIQEEIHDVYVSTIPLLEKLTQTVESANRVSATAEEKLSLVTSLIDKTQEKFSWLIRSKKQSSDSSPVESLITHIRAVSKGIGAFLQKLHT